MADQARVKETARAEGAGRAIRAALFAVAALLGLGAVVAGIAFAGEVFHALV